MKKRILAILIAVLLISVFVPSVFAEDESVPADTAQAAETPSPTETVLPPETPSPTETVLPTPTPEPTDTPTPTPAATEETVPTESTQISNDSCYSISSKDHPTGVKLPSEEEQKLTEENAVEAAKVVPNALGIQRINEEKSGNSLTELSTKNADSGDGIYTKKEINSLKVKNTTYSQSLPETVDNSKLKYFPQIGDQGSLGSCAAFAITYYQMTYTTAMARNWDVKTNGYSEIFSPKFPYNLANGGKDSGTWPGNIAYLMKNFGALTWDQFPYDNNYIQWPSTASQWESALKYKISGYGYINNVNTPDGLSNLKNALNNGMILTMTTKNIFGWFGNTIKNNPNSTLDDSEVGQWAAYYMYGGNASHELTIVGYNDDIWCDLNKNGQIDTGELGAFKIANSWGSGWGESGFAWFSYAAITDTSNGHSGIIYDNQVMYLTADSTDYTPLLTAEITLTTANRGDLEYFYGINWPQTTLPDAQNYLNWEGTYFKFTNILGAMFINWGGKYSIDGTTNSDTGTIEIDMSDIADGKSGLVHNWEKEGGILSYCFGIKDSQADGLPVTVNNIAFKNWANGDVYNAEELSSPQTYDNDYLWYHATGVLNPNNPAPAGDPTVASLPQITAGIPVSGSSRGGTNEFKEWRFTPEETGTYIFDTDSQYIYTEIQNSSRKVIYHGEISVGYMSFIRATLISGNTYILRASSVYCARSYNAQIYKIDTVSDADITGVICFDPKGSPIFPVRSGEGYSVTMKANQTSICILPLPESERSTVLINGKTSTQLTWVDINSGDSQVINIKVISHDGTNTKEYNVTVTEPVFAVTFITNGGSTVTGQTANYGGLVIQPSAPKKKGYDFAGWYTDNDTFQNAWNFTSATMPESDVTLYAKWTVNSYSVIFNSNGGSSIGTETVDYGKYIPKPDNPSKTGYTFAGWYTDNNTFLNVWNFTNTMPDSDLTFYSKWIEGEYTIKFSAGSGAKVSPSSMTVNNGDTYGTLPTPTKSGYYFEGWYTGVNGKGTLIESGDSVSITSNTTLYAKWVKNSAVALGKPSLSVNVSSYDAITLSWSAVANAQGYIIYISAGNAGHFAYLTTVSGGILKYNDTGLSTGIKYYYKIIAYWNPYSAQVKSSYSAVKSAITLPDAPTGLTLTPAGTIITVSWYAAGGAYGYEVYKATSLKGKYTKVTTTTNLSFDNTGITTGKPYYYKVRAYCMVGKKKVYGAYSSVQSLGL